MLFMQCARNYPESPGVASEESKRCTSWAHLYTVSDSLAPPKRGEGWGRGFESKIKGLLCPTLSSLRGGGGENKDSV
jgi:hypothetical protein